MLRYGSQLENLLRAISSKALSSEETRQYAGVRIGGISMVSPQPARLIFNSLVVSLRLSRGR